MADIQKDDYQQVQSVDDLNKKIILSGTWFPMEPYIKPMKEAMLPPFGGYSYTMESLQSVKIKDFQITLTNQTAGTSLRSWGIDWPSIYTHTSYFTNEQHYQYRTLTFNMEIQILGSARANGIIMVSFIPAQEDVFINDIQSNYDITDWPNMFHCKFLPIHENSTTQLVVPIQPPFAFLSRQQWDTPLQQYREGSIYIHAFSDIEILDTDSIKPSLTVYTNVDVAYGAPLYPGDVRYV